MNQTRARRRSIGSFIICWPEILAASLAIGGGSVIDAAKAAGILGTIKEGEIDDYFGVGMVSKKVKRIMDLIAVPTTSGTGSELTKFSVITDTWLHVKKLIFDIAIVPTEAIVDPELTYSCEHHVSMVTGLDTLTHLMEGYFNNVDEGRRIRRLISGPSSG